MTFDELSCSWKSCLQRNSCLASHEVRMKNWILWSFSRGSFQYDVLCALILVAIFAIPPGLFNDRPDYMRLPETADVKTSFDSNQNLVYTVKVDMATGGEDRSALRESALVSLQEHLESDQLPEAYRVEEVINTRGRVVAFALWIK